MSGGWSKAGDTTLAEMVVAPLSRYARDKSGSCSSEDCGIDGEEDVWGREILGCGRAEWGSTSRGTKENKAETCWSSD